MMIVHVQSNLVSPLRTARARPTDVGIALPPKWSLWRQRRGAVNGCEWWR